MRILFDQGTPAPLGKYLATHLVETAFELGWSTLRNGDLLARAEEEGFDLLVTTDQNLKYQQNLSTRKIAVVVITTTSWPRIRKFAELIVQAVDSATPGNYAEVSIPSNS